MTPRERKPNPARIRYDRESFTAVLRASGVSAARASLILDTYERQRATGRDMPCQSLGWHGPGHQSATYCEVTGGDEAHDENDQGARLHVAERVGEWTDERPYVEYWG